VTTTHGVFGAGNFDLLDGVLPAPIRVDGVLEERRQSVQVMPDRYFLNFALKPSPSFVLLDLIWRDRMNGFEPKELLQRRETRPQPNRRARVSLVLTFLPAEKLLGGLIEFDRCR
jgi:hypothetical protein